MEKSLSPGRMVLFGSGEASPATGKAHEWAVEGYNKGMRLAVLETPAGFEVNSAQVAGKVGQYIAQRLQNEDPQIDLIPARKRGSQFSPDDPGVCKPMLTANWVFLGPGSPTYAVRQLKDSLAFQYLRGIHFSGGAVSMASAAVLAFSRHTLPVYEIYKAGHDLYWQPGLNYLAAFGLDLVMIPHWNNQDGGADLDTSRCFMGVDRFEALREQLPSETLFLGIDELTAVGLDFAARKGVVMGKGGIVITGRGDSRTIPSGETFALDLLGDFHLPTIDEEITDILRRREQALEEMAVEQSSNDHPSEEARELLARRNQARADKDWALSDQLRDELLDLGWEVRDTRNGSELVRTG